jgi:hypothetical protein
MSESDTNNTQPLDHWSSDDLEADADNASTPPTHQELPHDAGTQSRMGMRANGDSQLGPTQNGQDATVSGGQGQDSGLLADPGHAAQDAKLVRRAIRNGWNVPDSAKPRIVGRLVTIVDQSPDDGDAIKAASVLRSMDAQDQDLAIKEHELARVDNGQATQAVQLYGIGTPVDAV